MRPISRRHSSGFPALGRVVIAVALVSAVGWIDAQPNAVPAAGMKLKREAFDRDPGWEGVNNRSARQREPRLVRQDFGYSAGTKHAGGTSEGEIGGLISPAGEAAFYARPIAPKTLGTKISASGTMSIGQGGTHFLLGFFNSGTVNEWRTPNSLAIRINGRGEKFFAYVEYCTAKWRAGGDSTPFPSTKDPESGRAALIGFPCDKPLRWQLTYDPQTNGGRGIVTATIDGKTALCELDESHKNDGATFNRFGILNVMKSADSGSEAWFDDVVLNGEPLETFSRDPDWDGRDNRKERPSLVRPWFDFGFSDTNRAGGKAKGELGGLIFRGDCREQARMACYGDRVGPLNLDKPLKASGVIAMTRGVSDSTTLFGFYHSRHSMRSNGSQSDADPENVLGIHLEGPSSDGFHFYPVLGGKGGSTRIPNVREFPAIYPDGKSRRWSLDYDPSGAGGNGQITVTLDGRSRTVDLEPGDKTRGTTFDRFGIVTTWIDGNSQNVYWDDLSYTASQE